MKCSECGKKCVAVIIDEGIGCYEYWGAKGAHTAYLAVSDCCEADVINRNGSKVTVAQVRREIEEAKMEAMLP